MLRSDKTYWAIRAAKNRPGKRRDPLSGNRYPRQCRGSGLSAMLRSKPGPRVGLGPFRPKAEPFTKRAPYRTGYVGNRR